MSLLPISPYITWKGLATNSAIPSNSRPDLTESGTAFKANPIRQWRKQLLPNTGSGVPGRRAGIGMPMDLPGGSVYLGDVPANTDCLLNASADTTGLKEDIVKFNNTNFRQMLDTQGCLSGACNPQQNRIKSSTTLLSKTYYPDRKSYMRSRGNLFDQKLTALPVPGITYLDASGNLLPVTGDNATRQIKNCNFQFPTDVNWYKIYITLQSNGNQIFTAYFAVNPLTDVIQNFYYVDTNNQYVDILLPLTGNFNYDYRADNKFINNKFTTNGTNIKSVIPYINSSYSNPTRLSLYQINPLTYISYKPTNDNVTEWVDLPVYNDPPSVFAFTFAAIDCLPSLSTFKCNTKTIYKPNNAQYGKQGAVDSSDRITRLKLNTVNKNAASYKNVFGSSASKYLGMASTPYFTKSKYQACVPMGLSGQKTLCIV